MSAPRKYLDDLRQRATAEADLRDLSWAGYEGCETPLGALCEGGSEVPLGSHSRPGATRFPSRSACVAARSGREASRVRYLERWRWTAQGELMKRALVGLMQQ
jgi:hypothetical protein